MLCISSRFSNYLLSPSSTEYFSSLEPRKRRCPFLYINGFSDISVRCGFVGIVLLLVRMVKVASVIRVPVRGRVIRIRVREAVVRAIVPIAAKAERANDVGINEVSVAPSIPQCFVMWLIRDYVPLASQFTLYWMMQRSPP